MKTDPETGEQTTTERKPKVDARDGHRARRGHAGAAHAQGPGGLRRRRGGQGRPGHAVGHRHPHARTSSTGWSAHRRRPAVTLNGGPAPFDCTGLRVGAAPTTRRPEQVSDGTTSSSGTVTCAIPAGVTAFPGLGAIDRDHQRHRGRRRGRADHRGAGHRAEGERLGGRRRRHQREARGGARADRRQERAGHRGPGRRGHRPRVHPRARRHGQAGGLQRRTSTRWSAKDEPPRAHRRHPVGPAARRPDAAHPAGRDRRGRRRRARRDRRPVRHRQVDAAQHPRPARRADLRAVPAGGRAHRQAVERRPDQAARSRLRLRVPAVQPAAGPHGAGERGRSPALRARPAVLVPHPPGRGDARAGRPGRPGRRHARQAARAASSSASRSPARWCADRA